MVQRERARRAHVSSGSGVEWVGGRKSMPFYVMEGEPYRPELVVWLQLPEGIVVGHDLVAPGEDPSVAAVLRRTMQDLGTTPQRLRVADEQLASEVRAAFGDRLDVRVAPTPEVDDVIAEMERSAPAGDESPSYLEEGRVEEGTVAQMFLAALTLYRTAPWKVAYDQQVLRLDIPALGVEGACVSIIGHLGESLGIVVFPSYVAFEHFVAATESGPPRSSDDAIDLGTTVLTLDFWRRADLPAEMRAEAARHGWSVAGPKAYPVVTRRDRDGVPAPLEERDVRVATECALAVASFFRQHRRLFAGTSHEPASESSQLGAPGVTVRLTMPYGPDESADESAGFDDAAIPVRRPAAPAPIPVGRIAVPAAVPVGRPAVPAAIPASAGKVGRNDPCPCGSGKKYKRCCLDGEHTARAGERRRAASHDLDNRLVESIHGYARSRFGDAWKSAVLDLRELLGNGDAAVQLLAPWTAYALEMEGRPVLEWFAEDRARYLSSEERAWLDVQRASWLSVWEVLECEPGVGVVVRDELTGETRHVKEVLGSRSLVRRDAVLARVATDGEVSLFCGMFPSKLPPDGAASVVARARRRLRAKGAVAPSRLRNAALGRALMGWWAEAVDERDARAARPPRLQNTDGEPLLFTTDHFVFAAGARARVEAALRTVEGVIAPDDQDSEGEYSFARPGNAVHAHWDNTIVGRAWVLDGTLKVETNSVARADRLRRLVEEACGGLLRHRGREHADPLSKAADRPPPHARDKKPAPPEAVQMLLEFKKAHYQSWLDQPLPALDGKTPRQATRTARGRDEVDLLLRTMENHEQRTPEGAFDFTEVRRELGLPES